MAQFFFVGERWLNVDKIASVTVGDDSVRPDVTCTVWFTSGHSCQFKGEDAKKLIDFLKKNKIE